MGYWSVVKPDGGCTNWCSNPSFETGTTLWSAIASGAIAQYSATGYATRGKSSGRYTPTSNVYDGLYYAYFGGGFSVDVRAGVGVPMRVAILNSSNGVLASTEFTGDGTWHRYFVSYESAESLRYAVQKNNSASTSAFYIDGVMIGSEADYDMVYFDGDYPGAYWTGTRHASNSSLLQATRKTGGYIYNLDDLSVSVCGKKGIGATPVQHFTQAQPNLEGELLVGQKRMARTMTLSLDITGESLEDLHDKRKGLWDILSANATPDEDPETVFLYTGSGKRIYGRFAYDSGMEFQGEDGFTERVVLRGIAYEPTLWGEVSQYASLTTVNSMADCNRFVMRTASLGWSDCDNGFGDGAVTAVAFKYSAVDVMGGMSSRMPSTIYVGGSYTLQDGGTMNRISAFNPRTNTFTAMGSGMNGTVRAIAVDAAGNVYAVGEFTTAGGVTVNRVAMWNGSSWVALGSGLNGIAYAIAIAHDGGVYVGGAFTTAGGVTVNYIAYWNGTTWAALGTTGTNGTVLSLAIDPGTGYLYVGGSFTTAGGVTVNDVAWWDYSAWHAMSTGLGGTSVGVYALCFDEAGRLYIGGVFTSAGGVTVANACLWNGSTYEALGDGCDNTVFSMVLYKGGILAGGSFASAGGLSVVGVAGWNGSSWFHPDFKLPGSTVVVYALAMDYSGNLYIGFDDAGTLYYSYTNSLTIGCSGKVYPMISINRSGGTSATVKWLENARAGKIIYLDYDLLSGETLQVVTAPGELAVVSDIFGEVWRGVLRNSDVIDFSFVPGTQQLKVYVDGVGSPTMTAWCQWLERFDTFDG